MDIKDELAYRFTAFGYDLTVWQSGDKWVGDIARASGLRRKKEKVGPGPLEEMKTQLYLQARGNNEDVPQNWQPIRVVHKLT
jgi:hypothetical protein